MPSNADVKKQPFFVITDQNGNVIRTVFANPTQIGLENVTSELTLYGRLALTERHVNPAANSQAIVVNDADTLVSCFNDGSVSGSFYLTLPSAPRKGQLHYIKDANGLPYSGSIVVSSPTSALIDGQVTKTITTQYGALGLFWNGDQWCTLATGGGSGSGNAGPPGPAGPQGPGDANASYLLLNTTGSLPKGRFLSVSGSSGLKLTDSAFTASLSIDNNIVATISGATFSGAVNFSAGLSGSLTNLANGTSYLVAGANTTITSQSNGQVVIASTGGGGGGGDSQAAYIVASATGSLPNSRVLVAGPNITINTGSTGLISITGSASSVMMPLFSMPFLAGVASTNTAISSSKEMLGTLYYNPTTINKFSGTKAFWWRAIVDTVTVETNLSSAVDLYDLNGIVGYPPGTITGSIMSSSNSTMTQLQANMTSVFNSITGSGVIEARYWRTVSGSASSLATCYSARLDVEFT